MQYFEKFNLRREPFSFTPDPDMFYRSQSRMDCLQELVVAIRLHRGVNAVIGGVGSGKTTLCRVLVRELTHFKGIDVYLILNADFAGRNEFLLHLGRLLGIRESDLACDPAELAERIAASLTERYLAQNRIVCLLIDEGQVMTRECFDALEELSAIEIQDGKLLQTVIFGQNEFLDLLSARPALAQGMNYLHVLQPFSFWETRAMVETRLDAAVVAGRPRPCFTWPALIYLHLKSAGYPRKIVRLCHRALIGIPDGDKAIRLKHVKRSAQTQLVPAKPERFPVKRAALVCAAILAVAWTAYAVFTSRRSPHELSGAAPPAASVPAPPLAPSEIRARVVEQTPPSTPATGDRTEAPLTGAIVKQAEPGAPPQFSEAEHAQAGTAAGAQAAVQPREPETKQAESDALPQVAETKDTSPAPDMTAPPEPAESLARVPEVQQAEIPAQPHEATAQLTEGRVETEAGTEAAAPVTAEAVAPPALLGQVKLKKGWSFAKRQEDVYGRRNKAVFDAMAKANPGLTSIFDAGPGTVVNFPAVAAPALPEGMVLLSLMRADNLAQALDYVVDRSTEQMPLRLFATFSPARGTRLDVILLRAFPNPEQAEQAKSALPPELAAQASVLTGFSHDTVFYSLLPPEIVPPEPASPVGTNAPPAPARPRPRSQPVKQAAPAPQQPLAPSPDRTPTPYVPGENQN